MLVEFFLELLIVVFIILSAIFSSLLQALIFSFLYMLWHFFNAWRLWGWLKRKDLPLPYTSFGIWQILVKRFYQLRQQHIQDEEKLSQLEQIRRDFIANVSHELRTPLTVLHGYLETLIEEAPTQSIFIQMQHQTIHMQQLVNDLLLLSRLEAVSPQQEKFTQIEILPFIQKIREQALHFSNENHHEIILDIPPNLILFGEPNELHSAFSNLLLNAVKYSPAQSTITVRAFADTYGTHILFIDQGPGIESEHIPRLTERFYRIPKTSHLKGTGLGLAIVKHVLLRHHAELKISSQINHGSTFECIFPNSLG